MSEQFFVWHAKGPSPLGDLGIDQQENPFRTDRYIQAMSQLGYECWILGTRTNSTVSDATVAAVKRGRLGARMEIPSLPGAAQSAVFWDGVYALSKQLGITDLLAETFGSPLLEVPTLKGETTRKNRCEFVILAATDDFEARVCSNHLRNIKKARVAGVTLRRGSLHQVSMAEHVSMIDSSIARRASRGEAVMEGPVDGDVHRAYLKSGAGELFQAVYEGKVVSSILFLRSARTAYNESAGTSPEGMRIGASPFLIHEACQVLCRESVRTFNLGGAPEGSTLARFKAGFGATQVRLFACASYFGPGWLKYLRGMVRFARRVHYSLSFNRMELGNKRLASG
jgi:hypothetical protein